MDQMPKKMMLELAWWLFTALAIVLVILPVISHTTQFPFLHYNAVFVFLCITLTRYIFNMRNAPFSHHKWAKGVLFFLCIPFMMYVIDGIFEFQNFLDNIGIHTLVISNTSEQLRQWSSYIKTEFVLTGVWSAIVLILFPIRLVVSVWRQINQNRV